MEGRSSTSSPSPYQSLGDRPEMELDLWEGQFNLSSLKFLDGDEPDSLDLSSLTQEELETYRMGSTCWGKDSSVTMGTVHQLQEAVGRLQEVHDSDEARYQHVKHDNDSLVKKIFVLEEIIRDLEINNINARKDNDKRINELGLKLEFERKKSEDYAVRIQELETDNATLSEKSKELLEKLSEASILKEEAECKLAEYEIEHDIPKPDVIKCFDDDKPPCEVYGQNYSVSGLDKSETDSGCHLQDSDDLVSELQMRLADMEKELRVARDQNKCLLEQMKNGPSEHSNYEISEKSLAEELRESSRQERQSVESEIEELKKSLSSQEHVNHQLQKYIDAVILNIMEKNPELLEVKKE